MKDRGGILLPACIWQRIITIGNGYISVFGSFFPPLLSGVLFLFRLLKLENCLSGQRLSFLQDSDLQGATKYQLVQLAEKPYK